MSLPDHRKHRYILDHSNRCFHKIEHPFLKVGIRANRIQGAKPEVFVDTCAFVAKAEALSLTLETRILLEAIKYCADVNNEYRLKGLISLEGNIMIALGLEKTGSPRFYSLGSGNLVTSEDLERHPDFFNMSFGEQREITKWNPLIFISMERINGCTLRQMLLACSDPPEDKAVCRASPKEKPVYRAFPEFVVRSICLRIVEKLKWIQSYGIAHKDLKPENYMFRETGEDVLIDYGFSENISVQEEGHNLGGTPPYQAHEMMFQPPLVPRQFFSDHFALGVIAFELLLGYHPFRSAKSTDGTYRLIMAFNYRKFWEVQQDFLRAKNYYCPLSYEFMDLVNNLLVVDQELRPSIAEILNHPFLTSPIISEATFCNFIYQAFLACYNRSQQHEGHALN